MQEDPKDDLFADPAAPSGPFRFDESVARVFPDMVRRSVPCYEQLVELTGLLGGRIVRPGTRCYDLGCSLGAAILAVLGRLADPASVELIAVDRAPAMTQALALWLRGVPDGGRVRPVCADLGSVKVENASLVILNLTLQFVPPAARLGLLTDIRRGLVPGGALILTEKVRGHDAEEAALLDAVHADFKRANGYSELEISRKRAALERVLIPDDLDTHHERLARAGFRRSLCWLRCLGFVSLLAVT